MVSGACSQRPLFFALAMSAISLSGRKSLDAAQVRRVEELSDHPEPPPLPHFCQARVFRGAEQCSRTPLPGSSFCFQHQGCLFAFECVMCTECVTVENRFCFICIWNHFFKQWRHRVPCPDHDTMFVGKDQTIFYSRHWVHTMFGCAHTASPSIICCLKLHSFIEFSKDSCHTICLMLDFVELRMFPGGCAMASSEYHWAPKSVDGGLKLLYLLNQKVFDGIHDRNYGITLISFSWMASLILTTLSTWQPCHISIITTVAMLESVNVYNCCHMLGHKLQKIVEAHRKNIWAMCASSSISTGAFSTGSCRYWHPLLQLTQCRNVLSWGLSEIRRLI